MKIIYLFFLIPFSLFADDRMLIDWTSEHFKTKETNDKFIIEYKAKAQAGQKLIIAGHYSRFNTTETVLWFQIVQNIRYSSRHLEPLVIRWEIDKNDFLKWKEEEQRQFFIEQRDDARLSEEQVKEIKKDWK